MSGPFTSTVRITFSGTELQSCGQDYVAWFSQSDLYTYVPVVVFPVDIYEAQNSIRWYYLQLSFTYKWEEERTDEKEKQLQVIIFIKMYILAKNKAGIFYPSFFFI